MFKFILIIVFILGIGGNAFCEEVENLDEIIKKEFYGKKDIGDINFEDFKLLNRREVKADFSLREISTDKIVESRVYKLSLYEGGAFKKLKIFIPIGQYYIKKPNSYFKDKPLCTGGGATSGFEVLSFEVKPKVEKKMYLLNEWSCGSMGCSYLISISDKNLTKMCN